MNIAIIIPFFQRTTGLLRVAIDSILNSARCVSGHHYKIIIIDDDSPVSAVAELVGFSIKENNIELKIIQQINQGPGAARNTGLNSLDVKTDVVAFLDSDDAWAINHVKNISDAFSRGANFYFADHQRVGEPVTRFNECGFQKNQLWKFSENIFKYSGDIFFQILKQSPVGTSTVAYDFKKYSEIRFFENINTGEDIMFWLDLSAKNPTVFFSDEISSRYGRGVNIFHGVQWGTTADLKRLRDSVVFHLSVAKRYPLSDLATANNNAHLARLDKAFASTLLGALRRREAGISPLFFNYFSLRPQFLAQVLPQALKMLVAKAAR